jgi:phage terminase large subunit
VGLAQLGVPSHGELDSRSVLILSASGKKNAALATFNAGREFVLLAQREPTVFAKEVLRSPLDPWQVDSTEAVFDYLRWMQGHPDQIVVRNPDRKNWFTVRAMHGPGKTFWLATLISTFGTAFPKARIPCIAPKMEQLSTRLWFELRKVRSNAIPIFQKLTEITATRVTWGGEADWLAFAQTATHAENLAGLHHSHQLVCVDEASGVPENLYPTIEGAVSTDGIQVLVLISNPTKNTGTFAYSHGVGQIKENKSDYYRISIPLDKAPRVKPDWVEKMRRKYGENSAIFKIRCLGEFADASADQVIALQWILDAVEDGDIQGDGSIPRVRVSIDVADGGEDETVITVARHYRSFEHVVLMKRYNFPPGESAILAAIEAEKLFVAWGGVKGSDDFVPDSLGVGSGCAGHLILKQHSVVRYQGGASSDDPKRWRCRRVQSYLCLRDAFRDKRIRISRSAFDSDEDYEDFIAQTCSIEYARSDDRVEDIFTKQAMKRKGIKSPDMTDSLAMQYATQHPAVATRTGEPVVEEIFVAKSDFFSGYLGGINE